MLCSQDGTASLSVGQSDIDIDGITIEGFAGKANIVEEDIVACKSVIHIVDKVIISKQVLDGAMSEQQDSGGFQQTAEGAVPVPEGRSSQIADASNLPSDILDALSDNENAEITIQRGQSDALPECDTIWDVVMLHPELSVLKEAFEKANFFPVVGNPNMTVAFFAPTNGAFKVSLLAMATNVVGVSFTFVLFDIVSGAFSKLKPKRQ